MQYRQLGGSGLKVPALTLGTGTFGGFPTFALGLFKRAMAAGYGEEEFAALIKVLRKDA